MLVSKTGLMELSLGQFFFELAKRSLPGQLTRTQNFGNKAPAVPDLFFCRLKIPISLAKIISGQLHNPPLILCL